MTRSEKLYAWLWRSFRDRPFTVAEFEATIPSSRSYKVLSELKVNGFLERTGRGQYRAVDPSRRVEQQLLDAATVGRALLTAPWPFAFTGASAVQAWTHDRYFAGGTRGYQPIDIEVRERDIRRWQAFLRLRGVESRRPHDSGTSAGAVVTLHGVPEVRRAWVDGKPVIARRRVLAYIRRNRYSFEPATELMADA